MSVSDNNELWEKGYEFSRNSVNHRDLDRQTFWNENVLYGDMTYDEYQWWSEGYDAGSRTKVLFP